MRKRCLMAVAGVCVIGASIVIAQPGKEHKKPEKAGHPNATQPEMQLPPGMTMEDMKACEAAATPGPNHKWLTDGAGVWHGTTKMWMAPDAEPVESECTSTVTSMIDGRFVKCEVTGEMPGMGPFSGFGIYGYDNVAEEFQATWVDNCGTGMGRGVGELSSDGKALTWEYTYNCPMTQGEKTFREVQRRTGKDTMVMEMYMSPPAGGPEYKMMEIKLTRKHGATAKAPTGAQ